MLSRQACRQARAAVAQNGLRSRVVDIARSSKGKQVERSLASAATAVRQTDDEIPTLPWADPSLPAHLQPRQEPLPEHLRLPRSRGSSTPAPNHKEHYDIKALANAPAHLRTKLETLEDVDPSLPNYSFDSLRRRVDHDTLKALTERPFRFEKMSEVQHRVLSLMPEIVGIQERPPWGMTRQEWVDSLEVGSRERAEVERKMVQGVEKKDMLVKAKTGTGKTVAFMVPAIERRVTFLADESKLSRQYPGQKAQPEEEGRILRELSRSSVGTLVISPTRELATQIANESIKLLTWHKLYQVQLLVGGNSRHEQIKLWRRGRKDVVVVTPGRLKDLLQDVRVGDQFRSALAETGTLVLDEADTLLDMGFSKDLEFIFSHLPKAKVRQTLLFSATVSSAIQKIARTHMDRDHLYIDCVPKDESNTHEHVPQKYTVLPSPKDQIPHVLRLLAHDQLMNPQSSRSIVFLPTTNMTRMFATIMRELTETLPHGKRTAVHEIHSRLDQRQRSRASDQFRNDRSPASILVTSDVSARGVDYPGVTRVIQVGVPSTKEQYVHRVGRTGRGGKEGGRGDIVLMPFESAFIGQMHEVPMTSEKVPHLAEEIERLGLEWDAAHGQGKEPYAERIAKIQAYIDDLLPALDEDVIKEVTGSLLGYYAGRGSVVNASHAAILAGIKEWTVEAMGLAAPPEMSDAFLAKLGFARASKRPSSGGRGFGGGGRGPAGGRGGFGLKAGGGRSGGFGGRRMHTAAGPSTSRRFMSTTTRLFAELSEQGNGAKTAPLLGELSLLKEQSDAASASSSKEEDFMSSLPRAPPSTFSKAVLDPIAEAFEAKGDFPESQGMPLKFGPTGTPYSGRSVDVGNKGFAGAYRILQARLSRNRIKRELRLAEYHEKGSERRRRLKSERHRRRFADLVRQKVQLVQTLYNRG